MENLLRNATVLSEEIFEELIRGSSFRMERIISPPMPNGDTKWYIQEEKELVILLQGQAKIEFENSKIITLNTGDYFIIESFAKHRVAFSSSNPITIWLTIHYK